MKKNSIFQAATTLTGVCFGLLKALLISLFLTLVVSPAVADSKYLHGALITTKKTLLIGLTALVLLFFLLSWKSLNKFFWKYKNTYRITRPKFTRVDFFFTIIYFFIIISFFTFNRNLKISQEIILFFQVNVGLVVLYLLSAFYFPQSTLNHINNRGPRGDVSDEPIQYLDEDLLNREVFIRGLYKEISELNMAESFVFGLYGNWGEGKSSVLNLLRILLKQEEKFIIVSFEPWNFKDEEAMLQAFFGVLENAISKEYTFPELRKLLFKYQKIISSGLSSVGIRIDLDIEEETIDKLKEKIEDHIESTGKKLLVIIDEIDRLEPDEIRMIFKLVRSNSKFKNSIFLLSMDDGKISEKLDGGNEFLEKIVQKPISLPKIEHGFIDKFVLFSDHKIPQYTLTQVKELHTDISVSTSGYVAKTENGIIEITETLELDDARTLIYSKNELNDNLRTGEKIFVEGIITKEGISLDDPNSRIVPFKLSRIDLLFERMWKEHKITLEQIAYFDKEFSYLYRSQISNLTENFRDAKRFLNSLYSSYPAIAKEVSPFDFICLEVIKVFAKKIYDDIFENWWFYVDQRSDGDSLNNPYTFAVSSKMDKRKQQTQDHIKELLDSSSLEQRHREAINSILNNLFPNLEDRHTISESDRKNKRIFTSSFLKYFTLSVPSTELSDSFFEDELKTWEKHLNESAIKIAFLKLQKQGKLVEFLDKIRRIYLDGLPKKLLPILLNALSKNVKNFSRKDLGGIWDSEYNKALMLVLETLNFKIDKKQINSEVKKIIQNTTDFLFAVDLILTTKKEGGRGFFNIYENVDSSELKKLLTLRLERHYIKEKRNILKENPITSNGWLRILYQWSSNWSDKYLQNKKVVTKYISNIFKDDPNHFIEFLSSFSQGNFGNEWNMNYEEYSKIYDLKPLVLLANKFLKKKSLTPEQRVILSKFVKIVNSNLNISMSIQVVK